MKPVKTTLTLALVLCGALASAQVFAGGHGQVRFGVFIGAPLFPWYYPSYYYPYYYPAYYPPVAAVPAAPPTYVERGAAPAAAPQAQGYWYYCADAKAYYPYVKDCPAGWQKVIPQPPQGG